MAVPRGHRGVARSSQGGPGAGAVHSALAATGAWRGRDATEERMTDKVPDAGRLGLPDLSATRVEGRLDPGDVEVYRFFLTVAASPMECSAATNMSADEVDKRILRLTERRLLRSSLTDP